jgi:hypothetical protein
LNLLVTVWKYTYPTDDTVGGAVPSGTPLYTRVEGRIDTEKPTMALLEQGLETPAMFSCILHPGTLVVEENYEVEVTAPSISRWYGKHFRILGVQYDSKYPNDPRGYVLLTLKRSEIAHGLQ